MEISIMLAKEIAKLFLIMFMGYIIVRLGLVKSQDSKCISVVLVYLVIPCVILNAFQVDFTPDIQKNLVFAFAAAIGIHILFLLANILLRGALHLNAIEQANIIYPNAGILIFPLVQALQGQDYIIYSSAFMTVQLANLVPDSKAILLTVYLAAITPACATVTSMAQLYDKDAAYSSSLYVLTTLLSIITMPIMVGLFETFIG